MFFSSIKIGSHLEIWRDKRRSEISDKEGLRLQLLVWTEAFLISHVYLSVLVSSYLSLTPPKNIGR